MNTLARNNTALLLSSAAVPAFAFGFFRLGQHLLGGIAGYWLALVLYWLLLLGLSAVFIPRKAWQLLLAPNRLQVAFLPVALLPVMITLLAPASAAKDIEAHQWLWALLPALLNGSTEELFWRGVFALRFPNNWWFRGLWSLSFFSLWHTAILFYTGINNQVDALSLLGGAAFIGLVYSFVSWRSHHLYWAIAGHVALNILLFAQLIHFNPIQF